jgi:glutamate formiminotransferase/formiminotetrahydrofolate cyclodeaminase
MTRLVECVPNFSEGRDASVIRAIADEIESVEGTALLHVDRGFDANRTVMTFVATPKAAIEAGFRAMAAASRLIDMRKHQGVHRRMGATDVFPFIPYEDITFEECVSCAKTLASRTAEKLGIPIYLYGRAAHTTSRERLPDIRRGGYESLETKLQDPRFAPDFGESMFHPTAGATAIGARDFLLAYNVNLDTEDAAVAKQIAGEIRESGKIKRDQNGKVFRNETGAAIRILGRLAACQADGWTIAEYGMAQVTMNLLNLDKTGLHTAFEAVKEEAKKLGVGLKGSELIGMCPRRALTDAGRHFLNAASESETDELLLTQTAIQKLGLDSLRPFVTKDCILEEAVALHVSDFVFDGTD